MEAKLIPGNGVFPKAAVKVDGTEGSYTAPQPPVSPNFPRNKQRTANNITDDQWHTQKHQTPLTSTLMYHMRTVTSDTWCRLYYGTDKVTYTCTCRLLLDKFLTNTVAKLIHKTHMLVKLPQITVSEQMRANLPNWYSALRWRPVTHAQTWPVITRCTDSEDFPRWVDHWRILITTRPTTPWKQCASFERWVITRKRINTSITMSITKDSTFATMAGEKYKVAFRHVPWAFSIDQCISRLFFFITVLLSMIFIINK